MLSNHETVSTYQGIIHIHNTRVNMTPTVSQSKKIVSLVSGYKVLEFY